MKRSILLAIFLFAYSRALSQKIICVETVIKSVYFYHRTVVNPKGTQDLESDIFDKGYYISEHDALTMPIDSIYWRLKYLQSDTVKYLTWAGDDLSGTKRYFNEQNCIDLYQKCINIDGLINPVRFFKPKHLKKDDRTAKIGLSYVKAEWLHLKVSDILASGGFNEPPTLRNPFANSKMFDIYIPLKVIEINNNVRLKHRFIIPNK